MPERQGSPTTAYALQIPDDWNGTDWDCCPLFFPDSPQWRAIVRGALQHLVRGRSWDETTGSVVDVQHTARLMSLAFMPSPAVKTIPEVASIMTCFDELVTAVGGVEQAIKDLELGGGEISECDMCQLIDAIALLQLAQVYDDVPAAVEGDNPHLDDGDLTLTTESSDVCGYVEMMVNGMSSTLRQLAPLMQLGWVAAVAAGAILLIAAWPFTLVTAGFALAGTGLLGIWSGIMSYSGAQMLADADWLDANMDYLKCSVNSVFAINTAADIYTVLSILKNEYPTTAKALATAIYTQGLATSQAAAEWADGDCPECVEGCDGLSWSFRTDFPECFTASHAKTTTTDGTKMLTSPSSEVIVASANLPLTSEGTYRLFVQGRPNPGTSNPTVHGFLGRVRRKLKNGTGDTQIYLGTNKTFTASEIQNLTLFEGVSLPDIETYDYAIQIRYTSTSGNRESWLRYAWLQKEI